MYSAQSREPISAGGVSNERAPGGRAPRSGRGGRNGAGQRHRDPGDSAAAQSGAERSRRESGNGHRVKTAADLDRDARVGFEAMRDLLKTQPPWSRDVELYRQKNYHQTLLFNHPLHPLAQSLDPMWVRTSYSLIASFRDNIARAEAALTASAGGAGKRPPRNSPAEQDLRKILTRFRQVLASEEGFYRQLVLRLVRHFGMEEMCGGILGGVGLSMTGVQEEGETQNDASASLSNEEKKDKVGLVYKAMICLGDIERYKEQYSDGYRREKVSGARPGKADEVEERFGKARAYYDVARALVPEDGSAYNQLAVISTYLNDDYSMIYNYFRALAIKVPFKNIAEILDRCLKKAFEKRSAAESDEVGLDEWKKEVGVLVAVLYRQNGFSNLPSLKATILPGLSTLLLSRHLPSESIVRLTVIAIGLHWHTRSLASLAPLSAEPSNRTQQAEESSLDFLLCVFIVLLTISASEIEDVMRGPGWSNPSESAIEDEDERGSGLHTSISAVLRRILPSLRLISKWVKLHLDYMSRFPINAVPATPLDTSFPTFWSAYYRLIEALARAFPLGMLPSLEAGLEEDEDMRGFLPISRGLLRSKGQLGEGEQVHPNEEQLMRIADLQVDATLILQAQSSGYTHIPEPESEMVYSDYVDTNVKEDDHASVSTEDDPVTMAMRASLGGTSSTEDEDEPEQLQWNGYAPQTSHTPSAKPTAFDLLQNLALDASPAYTPIAQRSSATQRALPSPRAPPLPPSGSGSGSPGLLFGGEGIWSMTREESNSQKGLKRDGGEGLSRPISEKPKVRTIEEGVKAIWDNGPAPGGLVQDRRTSAGTAQPPMDAAQLFAGISGLGPAGGFNPGSGSGMSGSIWDEQVGSAAGPAAYHGGAIGRLGGAMTGSQGQGNGWGQGSPWGGMGGSQQAQGGYGGYPTWG